MPFSFFFKLTGPYKFATAESFWSSGGVASTWYGRFVLKLLAICVSLLLICPPALLRASSQPSGEACAVFYLTPDHGPHRVLEKASRQLRQELKKGPSYQPLTLGQIDEKIRHNPQVSSGLLSRKGLALAYLKAKDLYYQLDFTGAKDVLDQALLEANGPESEAMDRLGLIEVHLLFALIYRAEDNPDRALDYMREAARLDPTRELSEYQYSPQSRSLFQKGKRHIKTAAHSTLVMESDPKGANVWVNGVHHGTTPLTLENFPAGRHDIVLVQENYKTYSTTIDLHDSFQVSAAMKRDPNPRRSTVALQQKHLAEISDQIEAATVLGNLLGVTKIIFLSLEEFAWNKRIVARMIDTEYRVSYPPAVVQIENSQDAPYVMNVLAEKLNDNAQIDMGKNLDQYAEQHQPEEVVLLGSRSKKSLLKKPLFWVLVGAVAAGAGAGIGLAVSGSGSSTPTTTSVSVSGPAPNSP
jgi:tetratricopeptide (TPR) repeat protein